MIPISAHHFNRRIFCRAVTPFRINRRMGVLKLSIPG